MVQFMKATQDEHGEMGIAGLAIDRRHERAKSEAHNYERQFIWFRLQI
ncbi:hypothetical protein Hanom_Chr14g01292941 [Helianthus anomalus]